MSGRPLLLKMPNMFIAVHLFGNACLGRCPATADNSYRSLCLKLARPGPGFVFGFLLNPPPCCLLMLSHVLHTGFAGKRSYKKASRGACHAGGGPLDHLKASGNLMSIRRNALEGICFELLAALPQEGPRPKWRKLLVPIPDAHKDDARPRHLLKA